MEQVRRSCVCTNNSYSRTVAIVASLRAYTKEEDFVAKLASSGPLELVVSHRAGRR